MFKTKCANPMCKKGEGGEPAVVYAYATSKLGTVSKQYCSNFCKKEDVYEKRYRR